MVYGIQTGGWEGIVYFVQWYCNSVGNADGEGRDSLVHESFELDEYLVKAKKS